MNPGRMGSLSRAPEFAWCMFCEGSVDVEYVVVINGVALCHWCQFTVYELEPRLGPKPMLTFTRDKSSWTCECGASYRRPFEVTRKVRRVVPSLAAATARMHLDGEDRLEDRTPRSVLWSWIYHRAGRLQPWWRETGGSFLLRTKDHR